MIELDRSPESEHDVDVAREWLRRRRLAWVRRSAAMGHADATAPEVSDRDSATVAAADRLSSISGAAWSVDVAAVERQRIVRGWTRLELAGAAHVDPKTLRDLLGRRRRPNLGTVQAVGMALGLALSDLVRFR